MGVENVITVFVLGVFVFSFFSFKSLAIFQQCSYKVKEFMPTIFKKRKGEIMRLSTYSLCFCVLMALVAVAFNNNLACYSYSCFIVCVAFSGTFYLSSKILKQPKFTNRYLRIYAVSAIFYGLIVVSILKLVFLLVFWGRLLFAVGFALLPILIPFIIVIGKLVNFPYDATRYKLSILKCKKEIAKNKNLIKIGITGSFGKTSVKNYLEKMLSTKYKVLASPKSYNTPLGICKTVKGGVLGYDVFIAEMGARYPNDINKLCKIVKPNVGIITGITEQHTATLGSIEDVKKAKNQLIEALDNNSLAFFSMQTKHSRQMYEEAKIEKFAVGKESHCLVYYKNFIQDNLGISFELVVGDESYKVFAPLIGEHNAFNVCMATAVSLKLGVKIQNILSVISTLEAVDHRAKIMNTPNGITVIDDGYNANVEGIKSTANAIKNFTGFKIAVTSGIVEVGKKTPEINIKIGKILAENFDLIIAVGVNAPIIRQGAEVLGREVICVEQTKDAKKIIKQRAKSNDVVAFFNDLTDRY